MLAVLGSVSSSPAFAAGEGEQGVVQWVRLTHAAFFDLYDEHPEGFTLRFFTSEGRFVALEYHRPDGRVFLDDVGFDFRGVGRVSFAEGERFCYAYEPDYAEEFCWSYFQSSDTFRAESDDGEISDFFSVLPGNAFIEQWGADWESQF